MERIYLDHAATTPLHPSVIDEMMPLFADVYGNPSSIHHFGRESRRYLDNARETLANTINASSDDIIITSGGTEADNLAIFGAAYSNKQKGKHIITTVIEHHAVLHACQQLEREGFEVTYLPVDQNGLVDIEELRSALRDDTILVTIMYGNNEIGVIQPLAQIGEVIKAHSDSIVFHTDAVQAYGIVPIDVTQLKVDLLSVSAHKINGPKGVGFLYIQKGISLIPRLYGGEQERKRRAGTENVPGIVGFAFAAKLAQAELNERQAQYLQYKQTMIATLREEEVDFTVNGDLDCNLAHVLNVYFPNTNVEALLVNFDLAGIAASSGSACTAGSIEPSHVLTAIFGSGAPETTGSVRFSFGYGNSDEQVNRAGKMIAKIVKQLTKM
ncbi:cysteine desulfurase family protein [Bacillus solimangrovi]|uniref:cysteine desulfurase n=1 Tax=Bacillus solimangrovi TaxID=1305675 RepID=A0A1E5LBN8_9BACI|nr:cysteine desulfurase family protein [Bacillus solimangrovi]OEH91508.1 cysteine desulfurase NifS [Bacillus solimangrovi]